jgi:hypothetical protein
MEAEVCVIEAIGRILLVCLGPLAESLVHGNSDNDKNLQSYWDIAAESYTKAAALFERIYGLVYSSKDRTETNLNQAVGAAFDLVTKKRTGASTPPEITEKVGKVGAIEALVISQGDQSNPFPLL